MNIPATMTSIRLTRFGGVEALQEDEIPVPWPGEHEVLVKVEAAGVNPVDYKIREGKYPAVRQDKLPYVLGRDLSGIVVALGPVGGRFAIGDPVYAMPAIERGCYTEYVVIKESEAALAPTTLHLTEAGAVPLAALTAWQGLHDHGGLQPGQRLLIQGGSGGVGHFAIQFAKAAGAHVITTVSTEHVNFARELGADQVIDYKVQRFEEETGEVDMVFDLIGGETQDKSWGVLKQGGIIVSTLTEPSQEKAAARGSRGLRYTAAENGAELATIARLIDEGSVRPIITQTFPLAAAAEAQRFLETQHPAGKVVLTVNGAQNIPQ